MAAKHLSNLLNPSNDGGLSKLVEHAQAMGDLVATLQAAVGESGIESIVAANIRDDGELVVLATSSAWAARLRFEETTLIGAAVAAGAEVSRCRIRVARN